MKHAVIAISGSQFKVTENQKLSVTTLNLKEGEKSTCDQVLLTSDEKDIKVGTPTVKDAKVEFEVVKNYKGDKVRIFRYKGKSRYRKTTGFRHQLTEIKITKISN
jgi:large subunit ribosomal protein L21